MEFFISLRHFLVLMITCMHCRLTRIVLAFLLVLIGAPSALMAQTLKKLFLFSQGVAPASAVQHSVTTAIML